MVKTIDTMKKLCQLIGKTPASIKMVGSNSPITILTLSVNGLNAPIQKTQTGKLDKKSKPINVLYPGNTSQVQGYI